MLTLFRDCWHAKINIWPHSIVFNEQKKCCARSKSQVNYENVQKLWPQCCKLQMGYRIRNITLTLELRVTVSITMAATSQCHRFSVGKLYARTLSVDTWHWSNGGLRLQWWQNTLWSRLFDGTMYQNWDSGTIYQSNIYFIRIRTISTTFRYCISFSAILHWNVSGIFPK